MKKYKKLGVLCFSFFMSLNFYTPVFAAFFQNHHSLTSAQVTLLFACYSLVTFLFEIPTGLIGDRIGEKISLIIGCAFTCLSSALFCFSRKVVFLFFGEILFGVGSTFFSGPFEALLYQFSKSDNTDSDYSAFVSRAYSLQWIALCTSFAGCYLLSRNGNVVFPFYATLAANLFTVVIALFLPKTAEKGNINTINIFASAIKALSANRTMREVCLCNAFFMALLIGGYSLLQPMLSTSKLDSSYNGLLYLSAAFIGSLGSTIFDRINKKYGINNIILIVCIVTLAVCFCGLAVFNSVFCIFLFVMLYRFIWGITSPMFSYIVNNSIEDDSYRDTVFSIISLSTSLMESVLLFIVGIFNVSSRADYSILAAVCILIAVWLGFKKRTASE